MIGNQIMVFKFPGIKYPLKPYSKDVRMSVQVLPQEPLKSRNSISAFVWWLGISILFLKCKITGSNKKFPRAHNL